MTSLLVQDGPYKCPRHGDADRFAVKSVDFGGVQFQHEIGPRYWQDRAVVSSEPS